MEFLNVEEFPEGFDIVINSKNATSDDASNFEVKFPEIKALKEEDCDAYLEFEVSFYGDDNFGDDWY